KELAKERGLKSVWLVTSNDNIDSLRFYQKRGFRITKVYPNAIDKARKIKPEVPVIGKYGIPLKDALELEYIV
ncbi:MAG: GNAT family N-acetyltransferase, partial [Candidatus Levybacteria bacterium]|nr:GNAT family N-acetyltransferase [Candidatus Levybacteria bacterium]